MPMPLSGLANTLSNAIAKVQTEIVDTQEQLASGVKKLNPGQAGVVTRLSAQASGYDQTLTNIGSAQSVISVAQASLTSIAQILTQMQSLANQASNDSLSSVDRDSLQATFSNLATQVTNLQSSSSVNGSNLLAGVSGISVTTGIDGSTAAQTTVAGVNVSAVTTAISNLAVNSAFATPTITTAENVAQVDTVTVATASLAAADSVTIGGLTFTSTAVTTLAQLTAAFANYISGTSSTSTYGAFSGSSVAAMQALYSSATSTSTTVVLTHANTGTQTVTAVSESGAATISSAITTAAVNQTDTVALGSTALGANQSIQIGGVKFTTGSSAVSTANIVSNYVAFINNGTAGTHGTFTGTNTAINALFTASASGNSLVLVSDTAGVVSSPTVVDPGTINAAAAVASLTTQLQTISTGQATLSAASTGLSAQLSNNNALKTGLTNTVASIQNIDAPAMQAKLQQLNNQQSIDYYLISQMNTEAAAILSIFR
jgi:flagellin-like hook-associated protein FlgL